MAHRGIWLAATACLVAGALAAPPGSGVEGIRSQAAETGYLPSGPLIVRPDPPRPGPAAPVPAAALPANPPAVPDLISPAPRRPTTAPVTRPSTQTISRPKPKPSSTPKPAKPTPSPTPTAKPTKPAKPATDKPKPVKPTPSIPPPRLGPPETTGTTTWKGKLISRTTPDGKTAVKGTKPATDG